MVQENENKKLAARKLEVLVIESDSGARNPRSKTAAFILFSTAVLWAVFQLWMASPYRFSLNFGILNDTEIRSIHLGFALFLSFLAYPAFKKSPRRVIGLFDWIYALLGAFCAGYIFIFYDDLALRSGRPEDLDVYVACAGVLLLFEATRRALGFPLIIIGAVLLLYTFYGYHEYVPDILRHKGQSISKMASHIWLTTEGVFGIALGVSANFVFLFVLFGSLLDKAGAGSYFIKVAFALVGHLRGGPAKAAVLASGMTGLVSGSSIANVVTTGTFTIPLMRRVGFPATKAGAIEVAASVNGQIMPPVMGAAAFLMVNYVGISYFEVVKHAFLPAVISYIALMYMVHLEAVKSDMKIIPKSVSRKLYQTLLYYAIAIASLIIFSFTVYYAIGWMKPQFGEYATSCFIALIGVSYVLLLWYSSKFPDLEIDDPNQPIKEMPRVRETLKAGLHFLLPIVVLIWFLMIERESPGRSAFYATMLMIVIIFTEDLLKSFFRKQGEYKQALIKGTYRLLDGLVVGSRNMIGIAVATAAAGIVVGVISLTGVGLVLAELIEVIAGDSLILILLLTAVICLILGMGLPTTANYIVVAALMANVVKVLAEKNGLYVPLIAIHLFVFYFGIMADVTPPVGLASFASAAISGADPIKTGVVAFAYSLRTAILPFFFIFNTEIIMVGVNDFWHGLWVFFYATAAILLFSSAMQNYLIVKNKLYESAILLLVSVILFSPNLLNNVFYPPYSEINIFNTQEINVDSKVGNKIKIIASGTDDYGDPIKINTYIVFEGQYSVAKVLRDYGISYENSGDKLRVSKVRFGSQAERVGFDPFGNFFITAISKPLEQPNPRLMYIPAMILFGFVLISQFLRKRRETMLKNISSGVYDV